MSVSDFHIIELDYVDSTNNYAMQLIDADKAQPGLTVTAQSQGAGKGQRGKTWIDAPGKSLLMSIIVTPKQDISQQFTFNACVAVAIANVLQKLSPKHQLYIKWPNDIIVNDKKAGGILIENVIKGSRWTHSVIGLGLNVKQESFDANLAFATSLKIALRIDFELELLRDNIRGEVMASIMSALPADVIMEQYNDKLYMRGMKQGFCDNTGEWEATVLNAHSDGTLEVLLEDGTMQSYQHGQVNWIWK